MTGLSDVYDEPSGGTASRRRLKFGIGLVLVGAGLALAGIVVAGSDLLGAASAVESIERGGTLAGLALPVALVGVFVVLPATTRIRFGAVGSATLCVLGVVAFRYAYPADWNGYGNDHTLLVSAVYLLGAFAAVWCLFAAVVNFKTRNDPGGTLQMNVVRRGRSQVVESSGAGSVSPASGASASTASDGGSSARTVRTPGADDAGPAGETRRGASADTTDRYCGNCTHFDYIEGEAEISPYCGFRDERMTDMDACEDWVPNRQ